MGSWDFGMCTKVSVWHFKYYSKAITMARHFIVYSISSRNFWLHNIMETRGKVAPRFMFESFSLNGDVVLP